MTDRRAWPAISPFLSDTKDKKKPEEVLDWQADDLCPVCNGKRIASGSVEASAMDVNDLGTTKEIIDANGDQTSTVSLEMPKLSFEHLFSETDNQQRYKQASLPFTFPPPSMFPAMMSPFFDPNAIYLQQLFHWSAALTPSRNNSSPWNNAYLNLIATAAMAQSTTSNTATSTKKHDEKEQQRLPDDQPLDLSKKEQTSCCEEMQQINVDIKKECKLSPSPRPASEAPTPVSSCGLHGIVSSTANAIKRSYSQADLDAAVKDIRCGRLGTRRASVVYGIPRSTLRNKIYKLEAAEEQTGEVGPQKKRRGGGRTKPQPHSTGASPPSDRSDERTVSSSTTASAPSSATISWEHLGQTPGSSDWTQALWSRFVRQQENKDVSLPHASRSKKSESPTNSTGSGTDWKRARPKRGQYRRYDKDALDEAVKSVRRGEMSVHRAGSFYGVPHSTLEYKVKERNLLRTKKRNKSVEETEAGDAIPISDTPPPAPTSPIIVQPKTVIST